MATRAIAESVPTRAVVLAVTVLLAAGVARAEMTAKELDRVQVCAELTAAGDVEQARAVCRAAAQGADRDARHLRRVADGLGQIGSHREAEAAYQRVVGLGGGGDLAAAWHGLGKAAAAQGAHERAQSAFRMALARDPGNPIYHNAIGVMLDLRGDHDAAQAAYYDGLAAAPDHPTLRHNLQISLARQANGRQPAELRRPSLEPIEQRHGFDRLVSEIAALGDGKKPATLDEWTPAGRARNAEIDAAALTLSRPRLLVPTMRAPAAEVTVADRTMRRHALRLGVYASQSLAWRALKVAKTRGGTLFQGTALKVRRNPTGDGFVLQAEVSTHTAAAEKTCGALHSRGLACVLISDVAAS